MFDIGNTLVKCAKRFAEKSSFAGAFPVARLIHYNACLNWVDSLCKEAGIGDIEGAVLCSVLQSVTELVSDVLRDMFDIRPVVVNNAMSGLCVPYENFGVERTMALLGAQRQDPGRGIIVVDAGTAITVDAIAKDGSIHAGPIAAGPGAMLEALVGKSGRLPLLKYSPRFESGNASTEECMQYGATLAFAGLVREAVSGFQNTLFAGEPALVVGTGGYIEALSGLGIVSRIRKDLVLAGCIDVYTRQKNNGG